MPQPHGPHRVHRLSGHLARARAGVDGVIVQQGQPAPVEDVLPHILCKWASLDVVVHDVADSISGANDLTGVGASDARGTLNEGFEALKDGVGAEVGCIDVLQACIVFHGAAAADHLSPLHQRVSQQSRSTQHPMIEAVLGALDEVKAGVWYGL